MSHSEIVRTGDEDFAVTIRGSAWQPCDSLDAVDGTIEIAARALHAPDRAIIGLIHGRLARGSAGGPFEVAFSRGQLREVLADALEDWAKEQSNDALIAGYETTYRIDVDARWSMTNCPMPFTAAPRYSGGAQDILRRDLGVGWENWMQDWPLEVSDRARLDEFCAFYDQSADPFVMFDVMRLALFSYDEDRQLDEVHSGWFEQALRRDFALHGHTVAYWAALDRPSDDPELTHPDPEFVFTISGLLRRVWDAALIPIDLDWRLTG